MVVNHPVRRRIVLSLMLLGNAGTVTVIGSLVVGFAGDTGNALPRISTLAAGLLIILIISRSKTVDRILSKVISVALRRFTTLIVRDYVQLLDLASNFAVAELGVEADSWVAEHQLTDLNLPDEGVLVLGVRRSDGVFVGAPRGHTVIHEQDTLILYGYADILTDLGGRKVGVEGDRAHRELVDEIADRLGEEPQGSDEI